jgi:hypothetical protein
MTKRFGVYLILVLAGMTIAGCGVSRTKGIVSPPIGLIFTHYKAPIAIDLSETPVGDMEGESGAHYLREPFFGTSYAWGDASTNSAAQEGRLPKIEYIDYEYFQILGLYSKFTIKAHGK